MKLPQAWTCPAAVHAIVREKLHFQQSAAVGS